MNQAEHYAEMMARMWSGCDTDQGRFNVEVWRGFMALARPYATVDWDASLKLARKYHTEIRACYRNCWRIATERKDLKYCEGYATSVIPMEHAWLVNRQGVVLDPTWCLTGTSRRNAADYFGMFVTLRQAVAAWKRDVFQPAWFPIVAKKMGASRPPRSRRPRSTSNQ